MTRPQRDQSEAPNALTANALDALDKLIGWSRGDHICKRCHG